ncbi:MAG TPA: serine hydrolase domain-containing protein [Steroidobacteraceae bacterium]
MDAPGSAEQQALGFSAERLGRIESVVEADVRRGAIPGAVMLIARRGRLAYAREFGWRDPVAGSRMRLDCLFRIASMTKPVASVAALLLVEEGRLQLGDPIAKYLPQLGERRVVGPLGMTELQPAARDITIQDLLRHTAGFTYGEFGTSVAHRAYAAADLMNPQQTSEELVEKLARLPLLHQPGTTFEYGLSTDVLGRIIEVVSGFGLDQFIAERIARPLQLESFRFQVAGGDADRLARALPDSKEDEEHNALNRELRPSRWISGGGGLICNGLDYLRFAQTLLNGGELEGVRLLGPKTVALMASDALPPDVRYGEYALGSIAPTGAMGQGFGLGLTVRTAAGRNPLPGSPGDCSWAGRWGTYFWFDPAEELACVVMMHASAERMRYRALARVLVYQALETLGISQGRRFESGCPDQFRPNPAP